MKRWVLEERGGIPPETWEKLYEAAVKARENAHAPYSKFQVGASVLTESGEIVAGCNVENATFGATVCAERNAFANAIVQGYRSFVGLCVVTTTNPPAAPCGICRQVIAEFSDDMPILLTNLEKDYRFVTLREILPYLFSGRDF